MPELILAAIGTLAGIGALVVAIVQISLSNDRVGSPPAALFNWGELAARTTFSIVCTAMATIAAFVFNTRWAVVLALPLLIIYLILGWASIREAREDVRNAKSNEQFLRKRLHLRTELAESTADVCLLVVCMAAFSYLP